MAGDKSSNRRTGAGWNGGGLALAAGLALLAGLVVAWFMSPRGHGDTPRLASGVLLPTPRPLPEFAFVDGDGAAFGRERLQGQWSLLFAGYTHCPDVCPNTLGLLKGVHREITERGLTLKVVFISVDPERDTPEQLARYTRYFNPDFVGVTGPAQELDKLASSAGLVYAKVPGSTPESYTVDHSAALVLVNPAGNIAGFFTPPFKQETLVTDLARVLATPV